MQVHILEAPQGGRRVLLSERMMRDLRMLAIEGFIALPRRGVEVGGILFGENHGSDIRLTAFEEVPCEHRYGPSYALSQDDRTRLKALLADKAARQLPVAGFFRSFTYREPVIEAADEELVREQFPTGTFVCLMLQPLSAENCVASLRFFCDGQLLPETDEPAAAFDPRLTPTLDQMAEMPAPVPAMSRPVEAPVRTSVFRAPDPPENPEPFRTAELPQPPEAVQRELPSPPPHQQHAAWPGAESLPVQPEDAPLRVRWGLVAAICLASIVGGAVAAKLWIASRSEHWTELHLDARPVGGQVEVTWDTTAPRTVDATKGLLAVTDGDTQTDIPLDPAQLHEGKYTYTPTHGEVGVRLILYSGERGTAGDSARLAMVPVEVAKHAPAPPHPQDADRATSAAVKAPAKATPRPVREAGTSVPPTALHEVQPQVPEGIRSRITSEVIIPVEVQVNERGQVVRAVSKAKTNDSVARYLSDQAQKAAREWRFSPARSGSGEHVAATKTLRFVFTPRI
jgi:hypothetical protein